MKKITLIIAGILMMNFLSAQTLLQTLLQTADISFKSSRFILASSLYKSALKNASDQDTRYIYFQLGECARMQNKFLESRNWYEKAITAGSDSTIANLYLGEALIMNGDFTSAKSYIEKYLKLNPNSQMGKISLESCELDLKAPESPVYEIKNIKSLNTDKGDYGAGYFKDNKIIFSSNREKEGFTYLYESAYDSQKGDWSIPVKVSGTINTVYSNEGTFAYDAYKNLGYYSQYKTQCNIMVAHYNDSTKTWEDSKLFDFNSEKFRSQQQALSTDGKTLYFASNMPGGYGGSDLYVIKNLGGIWGKPENIGPTINTMGNEGFPFISGDTLLVFSSDGRIGYGGLDIYTCTINKDGTYGEPVHLKQPINSCADDFGMIFKKSKDEGIFCSNRTGGIGDDDFYAYNQIPLILTASGNVTDKSSLKNIGNAVIIFKGNDGSIDSVYTDSIGNYKYTKIKPNVSYSLSATKKGYIGNKKNLTVENEKYSKTFNKDNGTNLDFILINETLPVAEIKIAETQIAEIQKDEVKKDEIKRAEIQKAETQLAEVKKIEIINSPVKSDVLQIAEVKKAEVKSDEIKVAEIKKDTIQKVGLIKDSEQQVVAEVKKEEIKNTTVKTYEEKITEAQKTEVKKGDVKIAEVKKAGIQGGEIEIDNIYYDYDKSDLRQESKAELDKLVKVFIEKPEIKVQISAHTDERGNKDYNDVLSQKRAQSVVDYLISKGISSDRLIAKGYGFSMPVIKNAQTEEEHQMNRRTTFRILKNNESIVSLKSDSVSVSTNKIYYIIVGSHPTRHNANKQVSSLKRNGFSDAEMIGLNEAGTGWRVAIKQFISEAEALKELPNIRKTENPDAWILEKEKK